MPNFRLNSLKSQTKLKILILFVCVSMCFSVVKLAATGSHQNGTGRTQRNQVNGRVEYTYVCHYLQLQRPFSGRKPV